MDSSGAGCISQNLNILTASMHNSDQMNGSNKIIVTGGTGFIGSHTIVTLQEKGFDVVVIDNLSNSTADILDRIQSITGIRPIFSKIEIRNREAVLDFIDEHQDSAAVVHFAAIKAVGESVEQPAKYYQNNISGLLHILDSCQKYGVDNFIFSSSATVYGQPDVLPVMEETPFQPAINPYGNTKQIGEEIIRDICRSGTSNLQAVSLRYFNPIGAHPSAKIGELPLGIPKNLMPFITQSAAGVRGAIQVFGSDYNTRDGTAIRDYIHVMDVAEAHVVALERLLNGKNENAYEVFNLGTGEGYTVLEVIQSFERTTGLKLDYTLVDRRPGDYEKIFANTDLAAEKLGWKTKYSLDDMTRTAWEWEKQLRGID